MFQDATIRVGSSVSADNQVSPVLIPLDNDRMVAVFATRNTATGNRGIEVEVLDSDLSDLGGAIDVVDTTGISIDQVDAATLSDGRFVVVWAINLPGADREIAFQVFNADGSTSGPEGTVADAEDLFNQGLAVTALASGGFAIAWANTTDSAEGTQTFLQRFDGSGAPVGGVFTVASDDTTVEFEPDVATLENGDIVLSWRAFNQSASDNTVTFQILDGDTGAAQTGQIELSLPSLGEDFVSTASFIAPRPGGGFFLAGQLIADSGDAGLFVQPYNASGATVTGGGTILEDPGDAFLEFTHVAVANDDLAALAFTRVDFTLGDSFAVVAPIFGDGLLGDPMIVEGRLASGNTEVFDDVAQVDVAFQSDGSLVALLSELDFTSSGTHDIAVGRISIATTGTPGDDLIPDAPGAQAFFGGAGIDTLDFSASTDRVLVDLQSDVSGAGFARFFGAGAGEGDTFFSIENVIGSAFADNLRGDGAANVLEGGGVSDRLYGRAGDDTLDGGAGADAMYGNLGADEMTGGTGAIRDRFIYFQANETGVGAGNRDVITDFTPGEDRIELSRIDADITQGFKQRFDFIGDAAFSNTAGELRFEQVGGATIVQADRDGDGVADFEIELTGTLTLTATDFLI
ncbi:M10 family metallopeptidase C-terminal domain-containing protein [Pseudaestuariivita atlantica]|uniref:M10 family metallopeptidase C-terminal domain-containing protein n=1 Tax=Pseudaestuariivita atlantica TaxID=1317121 RepID=UPI001F5ECB47|nr:M10 family metallopeptidase C-terminal domain-containing protein [Pseudaestuariivita atlantica]